MAKLLFLILFQVPIPPLSSQHPPLHKHLYPSNDEYDALLLNPETLHGAPYGGFSRASSSRLAQLPLRTFGFGGAPRDDEVDTEEEYFFYVTDGTGRRFSCRSYSVDELTAHSRDESLFDVATLATTTSRDDTTTNAAHRSPRRDETRPDVTNVDIALSKLNGTCSSFQKGAQPHKWRFEWCYRGNTPSFIKYRLLSTRVHNMTGDKGGTVSRHFVNDFWHFGGKGRLEEIDLTGDPVVSEVLERGGDCPSVAEVTMRCCSQDETKGDRSEDFDSGALATLTDAVVEEDNCRVVAEVCSRLLCLSQGEEKEDNCHGTRCSVTEVLNRALGGEKKCLSKSFGCWRYIICPGYRVMRERIRGNGNRRFRVVTRHFLGYFRDGDEVEDDYLLVRNYTKPKYVQEFVGGDVCFLGQEVDEDSPNSHLKGLVRNATVRYGCGEAYDLVKVKDYGCHYTLDVTLPDLCHHELFRSKDSSKREGAVKEDRVVKCLPMDL